MTEYSIWMLEYANVPVQSARAIYSGFYAEGENFYFPFCFTLIKGNGKNILIDSGIDFTNPAMVAIADMYNVQNRHNPDELLREIGVMPEDISEIILTHAHWDHMGGLGLFPNAQVFLQKDELFLWLEAMAKPATYDLMRGPLDISNMHEVLDVLGEGRLKLLDGPIDDVLPGIHIHVDRLGHSFASQLVVIENEIDEKNDKYIAVGDVIYHSHNLTGVDDLKCFIPNTAWAVGSVYYTLQTYEKIYDLVSGDMNKVLIAHGRETWERYPTIELQGGMHLSEIHLAQGEKSKLA